MVGLVDPDMADVGSPGGRYKVERVVDRYDLEGIPEELEERWIGENGSATSLRTLARDFNLTVMERTLSNVEHRVTTPELETMYDILKGEEGSGADRTQVRRDLERHGVDVSRLEADFVTHQAIHTYLTKGRGISKPTQQTDPLRRARETIDRLRSRTAAVTSSELGRLEQSTDLTIGEVEPLVTVMVNCQDCGSYTTVTDLLDAGGCDCPSEQSGE